MYSFELTVCYLAIAFGLLTILASLWTLYSIHKRKSLRYLRAMTVTILVLSIVLTLSGALDLKVTLQGYNGAFWFFFFMAIGSCITKSGNFALIWLA